MQASAEKKGSKDILTYRVLLALVWVSATRSTTYPDECGRGPAGLGRLLDVLLLVTEEATTSFLAHLSDVEHEPHTITTNNLAVAVGLPDLLIGCPWSPSLLAFPGRPQLSKPDRHPFSDIFYARRCGAHFLASRPGDDPA